MEKTETVKRKGTPKSEAIIGTGVGKLSGALQMLTAAAAQFGSLEKTVTEQSLTIADNEAKINELKTKYAEEKRKMEVQLELDKKEGITKIVTEYLVSNRLLSISFEKYDNLTKELEVLKAEQQTAINKAVGAATSSLSSKHESENKVLDAEYKAKEANNLAKIESLTTQLAVYKSEIDSWKRALDEERKASVERAKAGSVGSINVGQPTGR